MSDACVRECMRVCASVKHSPHYYNEEVQSVPRVAKVTVLTYDPKSHHLHHHFPGKKHKDPIIHGLHIHTHTHTPQGLV